jgi:hypothetical protein
MFFADFWGPENRRECETGEGSKGSSDAGQALLVWAVADRQYSGPFLGCILVLMQNPVHFAQHA